MNLYISVFLGSLVIQITQYRATNLENQPHKIGHPFAVNKEEIAQLAEKMRISRSKKEEFQHSTEANSDLQTDVVDSEPVASTDAKIVNPSKLSDIDSHVSSNSDGSPALPVVSTEIQDSNNGDEVLDSEHEKLESHKAGEELTVDQSDRSLLDDGVSKISAPELDEAKLSNVDISGDAQKVTDSDIIKDETKPVAIVKSGDTLNVSDVDISGDAHKKTDLDIIQDETKPVDIVETNDPVDDELEHEKLGNELKQTSIEGHDSTDHADANHEAVHVDQEVAKPVEKVASVVNVDQSEHVPNGQVEEQQQEMSVPIHQKSDHPLFHHVEPSVEHSSLSVMLGQLYGGAIDEFAAGSKDDRSSITVDCTTMSEDDDFQVNIVTTLCPFLRNDGPCGQLRHPSYVAEDSSAFCSAECFPHINMVSKAIPNRHVLIHKHETSVFRSVANSILAQYCVECRPGCLLPV